MCERIISVCEQLLFRIKYVIVRQLQTNILDLYQTSQALTCRQSFANIFGYDRFFDFLFSMLSAAAVTHISTISKSWRQCATNRIEVCTNANETHLSIWVMLMTLEHKSFNCDTITYQSDIGISSRKRIPIRYIMAKRENYCIFRIPQRFDLGKNSFL